MPDYKKLYFKLFAALADAVEELERGQPFRAKERLIVAQQEAEEAYLSDNREEFPKSPSAGDRSSFIFYFLFRTFRSIIRIT